jgi:MFS family permease
MEEQKEISLKRTRSAYMLTRLLMTPFWALFSMLPYILYKDLKATTLQVTLVIILKPFVSIFSTYWSSAVNKRPDRLLPNVIWASVIGYLPFFFYPFVDNPWFFVATFGLYMTMYRGVIPGWMEIFKLNIPEGQRERIFAYSTTMSYIGDALFPFLLGWLLDSYFQAWRWIFPMTALISLSALFFQLRIPIPIDKQQPREKLSSVPVMQQFMQPWKNAWDLLRRRTDFALFQIGFMLGGGGLMVMQPALPGFFMGVLNLTYTELAVALTLCKGVGFALTSPLWAKWMSKVDIYRISGTVTLVAAFFPLFLLGAPFNLTWLYLGYMSWHLSGPIFAKEEDSSVYSSVNVLSVGLRGCVAPAFGALMCAMINPTAVMFLGSALCLLATARMFTYSKNLVPIKS